MQAYWLDTNEAISRNVLDAEGILYREVDVTDEAYRPVIDDLKAHRGYVAEDVVELGPGTPNLEAVCQKFIEEHLHSEDEVRLVLEGEGIFDIRSKNDRWMRIVVEQGDLIVVPEGRFHKFMLTDRRRIRCVRLFQDVSGWVPQYRGRASN